MRKSERYACMRAVRRPEEAFAAADGATFPAATLALNSKSLTNAAAHAGFRNPYYFNMQPDLLRRLFSIECGNEDSFIKTPFNIPCRRPQSLIRI